MNLNNLSLFILVASAWPAHAVCQEKSDVEFNKKIISASQGREFLVLYARIYIDSLLYKEQIECVYHNSTSDNCGKLRNYSYEKPQIILFKRGDGIAVVFSQGSQELPFAVFRPDAKGYYFPEEGGVSLGDESYYVNQFKTEW